MAPLFTGNFFIRPNYIDNYWIKDQTFFSDMNLRLNNAALGMELSALHNWSFAPVNLYSNMDMGTMLSNFWSIAQNNANAQMSSWMTNMPQVGGGTTAGILPWSQQIKTDGAKTHKPKDDLTDEEKEEFEEYTDDFNSLYEKLDKIDSETAKKLGLTEILEDVKGKFDKADTPEKVLACIKALEEKISQIKDESLKKILVNKMPSTMARDEKVSGLYTTDTSKESVEALMNGAAAITKENIINELDIRLCNENSSSPIEVLTNREDADEDKIKNTVEKIVNVLLQRAADNEVKDDPTVKLAKDKLAEVRDKYMKEDGEDKEKVNLNNAFIDLYKAIKMKEAKNMDEKNKEIIDELPNILKEKYLDNDGKLKPEYRINENNVADLMKSVKGGTQVQAPSRTVNYAAASTQYTTQTVTLNGKKVEVDGITGAAVPAAAVSAGVQVGTVTASTENDKNDRSNILRKSLRQGVYANVPAGVSIRPQ